MALIPLAPIDSPLRWTSWWLAQIDDRQVSDIPPMPGVVLRFDRLKEQINVATRDIRLFDGDYRLSGEDVYFATCTDGRNACLRNLEGQNAELAATLSEVMNTIQHWRIDGNTLELQDGGGRTRMRFTRRGAVRRPEATQGSQQP